MIKPATATAMISNAIPAQNRSHGDELIVIAKPSFGWIFSRILLRLFTASPLVMARCRNKKAPAAGNSSGLSLYWVPESARSGLLGATEKLTQPGALGAVSQDLTLDIELGEVV